MSKQLKTFFWGLSGFLAVAVCSYTANLADIRDLDFWKIATILITVGSGYIVNGITKALNK